MNCRVISACTRKRELTFQCPRFIPEDDTGTKPPKVRVVSDQITSGEEIPDQVSTGAALRHCALGKFLIVVRTSSPTDQSHPRVFTPVAAPSACTERLWGVDCVPERIVVRRRDYHGTSGESPRVIPRFTPLMGRTGHGSSKRGEHAS